MRASIGHLFSVVVVAISLVHSATAQTASAPRDDDWPVYGGSSQAQHYSALKQIDRANVSQLQPAWTFHTGALSTPGALNSKAAFEANPVLWHDTLFFDTPFNVVFALDASTGQKLWSYDPRVSHNLGLGLVTSRGVALWHATTPSSTSCNHRVFVATLTAKLIALDAQTGTPCLNFGNNGFIDLSQNVNFRGTDDYDVTSPPAVVGNVVVVGSSIGDNRAVEEESGIVRGYDAVTGKLLWTWDPIPWAASQHPRTGAGNVWTSISADIEHSIVYLATGSASPDYWGGFRKGNNQDANSLVAVDARTGRKLWAFQFVHHDIWDYDLAAEPLLFTWRSPDGKQNIPAVVAVTKTGMVFVFNRLTGTSLFPIQERAVPQTTVPGEQTSPTQPFSSLPTLAATTFGPKDIPNRSSEDHAACVRALAEADNRGLFTPVGKDRRTLLFPGPVGGVNWGSPALDPATGILYANVNQLAFLSRLVPQPTVLDKAENKLQHAEQRLFQSAKPSAPTKFGAPDTGGSEVSAQAGAPYQIERIPFLAPSGLPCAPEPWGASVAMDLNTGKILWKHPLGTLVPGQQTGSPTLGGPIVTAGGLLFTAATVEPVIRAFNSTDGSLIWQGALPAPAQAVPMTFLAQGRQFLVIAAGGHGAIGTTQSDALVAFALPAAAKTPTRKAHTR